MPMPQFTIVIEKTITGVDASVPSIRECETWAATEDDAIASLLDRLAFFLQLQPGFRHLLDFMREEDGKRYYKLMVK
jgi:tRNA A37 threonylcarbamoyltransferase TsaD